MRKLQRGFTLVELLVVVAIITVLMALLLSSLGQAKKMARVSVCLSNLRQMGLGYQMYVQDNNGKSFYYVNNQTGYWMAQIAPYAQNIDKIRYCPETVLGTFSASSYFGQSSLTWWLYNSFGSYGLNHWLYINNPPDATGVVHAPGYVWDSSYDKPAYTFDLPVNGSSEVPVSADCDWVGGWPLEVDTLPTAPFGLNGGYVGNPNHMQRYVMNRHGNRTNVNFLDGHAEAVPLGTLWQLTWHVGWVGKTMVVPQ